MFREGWRELDELLGAAETGVQVALGAWRQDSTAALALLERAEAASMRLREAAARRREDLETRDRFEAADHGQAAFFEHELGEILRAVRALRRHVSSAEPLEDPEVHASTLAERMDAVRRFHEAGGVDTRGVGP